MTVFYQQSLEMYAPIIIFGMELSLVAFAVLYSISLQTYFSTTNIPVAMEVTMGLQLVPYIILGPVSQTPEDLLARSLHGP